MQAEAAADPAQLAEKERKKAIIRAAMERAQKQREAAQKKDDQ